MSSNSTSTLSPTSSSLSLTTALVSTSTPTSASIESLSSSSPTSAPSSSMASSSSTPISSSSFASSISSSTNAPSSSSTTSLSSSTTTTTTSSSTTTTTTTTSPTTTPVPPTTSSTPSAPANSGAPDSVTNPTPNVSLSRETLRSTVFVTDSLGHTSVPSAITTVITSISNGVPFTTTEVQINPTLGSDSGHGTGSSFFKNTGAVAGVFVLVGLAAASIVLWALFGLRRRRRNRRIEHDTAVSATLAAAGFHRTPLDDDEFHGNSSRQSRAFAGPDMEMRSASALALGTNSSVPSAGRTSGYHDSPGLDEGFNPYHEYGAAAPTQGYIPARTQSPPPAFTEPYRDASGSEHPISHSASQSVGSTEPLLAAFARSSPVSPAPSGARLEPPTPPPRNPRRISEKSAMAPPAAILRQRRQSTASSVYSAESHADERLNPALRHGDMQDSEDYSRPVLGVRNIPDGVSQSGES